MGRRGEKFMIRHATVWALILLLLAGCAAKRPVVYVDPSFDGKRIRQGTTAFWVPDNVDIKSIVQDFVRAFDGNPAVGVSFLRSMLIDYLTDVEQLLWEDMYGRGIVRLKFKFLNLAALADTTSVNRLINFNDNKYGIISLNVADPEALACLLENARVEYLILFQGLTVTRGASVTAPMEIPLPGGEDTIIGGGESKHANLVAQGFIWGRESQSLLWHGFIHGQHRIGTWRGFTRNTVKGIAEKFALDLVMALK